MNRDLIAKAFFGSEERRRFYSKLATMTRHNIGVLEGVGIQRDRLKRRRNPASRILDTAVVALNSGQKLHVALGKAIPGEEAMLIRSGLDSGHLPDALDLASDIIKARQKIIQGIREALAYPILLVMMFLLVLFVVAHHVVPQLALLSDPATWRPGAYTLYLVASFINSPLGVVTIAVPLVALGISIVMLPHWTGRLRIACDRMPPWSFYRLVTGSVWLFTLATLLRAKIQISHALDAMLDTPGTSAWLRERINGIKAGLAQGKKFGKALDDAGHGFPDPELIDDLLIYSQLPGFEDRLGLIAKEWLDAGLAQASTQAKIINAVCISLIIAMMSGLALAVASLQQSLGLTY